MRAHPSAAVVGGVFAHLVLVAPTLVTSQLARSQMRAVITFGDSLTDTVNYFKATGWQLPPAQFYWKGRFTNEPGVWVDWLPKISERLQVANFAYAGATACDYSQYLPAGINTIPSLATQVQLYKKQWASDKAFRKALSGKTRIPTIWAGHNDIVARPLLPAEAAAALPTSTVACILNATAELLQAGHQKVILGALAPIDRTPRVVRNNSSAAVASLVKSINDGLKAGAAALQKRFPSRSVLFWDVNTDTAQVIKKFRMYGFKRGSEASCILGLPGYSAMMGSIPRSVCPNPQDYVFYDEEHPSSRTHSTVADSFASLLLRAKIITSKTRLE